MCRRDGDTTIDVLDLSYTFASDIAASTVAFAVKGFSANVADFVSLEGDLGFKKVGTDMIAVGSNVTAKLDAGTTANVSLTNASFGLIMSDSETAFELKNGRFAAGIEGMAEFVDD